MVTQQQTEEIQKLLAQGDILGQQASKQTDLAYSPISVSSLNAPTPTLISASGLSDPSPDTTDYSFDSGNALIDTGNKEMIKAPSASDVPDWMTKLLGQEPKGFDTSQEGVLTTARDTVEQQALTQQRLVRVAQAELAGIQAQIQGIVGKRDAQNLILEKQAGEGQVVGTILNRQQQEINRQAAIEALPLQALALAAQAKVQAAQGESEYAQSSLKAAQDKLDTVFQLKIKNEDRKYDAWKDLRSKAWDYASDLQKEKLRLQEKKADQAHADYLNEINDLQSKSTALMNTNPEIAARLSQLDPKSKTYLSDKAALLAQVKPKIDTSPSVIGSAETGYLQFNPKTGRYDIPVSLPGGGLSTTVEIDAYARDYLSGAIAAGNIPQKIRGQVLARSKELALEPLIAQISSYPTIEAAKADLEKNKAQIIQQSGQEGYDKVLKATNDYFAGKPLPKPRTAEETGKATGEAIRPLIQAFHPENLYEGTKTVGSSVGSFFKGLFEF